MKATINPVSQVETTFAHAYLIHKAMKGDQQAQKQITVGETTGLKFNHNFNIFIEINRDRLALVGEIGVCR